jgi:hypothetical protein
MRSYEKISYAGAKKLVIQENPVLFSNGFKRLKILEANPQ